MSENVDENSGSVVGVNNDDQQSLENDDEYNDSDMNVQDAFVTSTVDEQSNQSVSSQVASTSNDNKDPLPVVVLDEREENVFDDIFGEDDTVSSIEKITFSPGGTKRATTVFDGDCEMTYSVDANAFEPNPTGFQMKSNDILSGNMPFKQNVSIFLIIYFHWHSIDVMDLK